MINSFLNKKIAGQTLIETMITLVFISVSVIALVRFQNYLAYSSNTAQQKSEAVILANKQQEILRDFQVLNNTAGYTSYQSIASGTSTVAATTTTYTLTWTVTSYTNPTYKTIDVVVSWVDRYNNSLSIEMVTNVAGIDPTVSAAIM